MLLRSAKRKPTHRHRRPVSKAGCPQITEVGPLATVRLPPRVSGAVGFDIARGGGGGEEVPAAVVHVDLRVRPIRQDLRENRTMTDVKSCKERRVCARTCVCVCVSTRQYPPSVALAPRAVIGPSPGQLYPSPADPLPAPPSRVLHPPSPPPPSPRKSLATPYELVFPRPM